ncbi:terminase small subunit [Methylobacterium bullatum]|uniref:DNA packaging protein n=1 Tax=Methylobacterium bullatum TaxID=570505 RepID=A0AAV4ZDK9_9HYPH|nr:terminase small subunit [Methylobacterium bullatum]MBD8902914.1 hypothetical protein [Methylobacterium bullatum]GJD41951.1 hypothetical protein OICFNHDK_4437 [Methylobacterium bullatum]
MFDPAVYDVIGVIPGDTEALSNAANVPQTFHLTAWDVIGDERDAPEAPSSDPDDRTCLDAAKAVSGPLVSGPDLASLLGLNVRTLNDLASRGIIVKHGRGEFDRDASVRSYIDHLRTVAAGRTTTVSLTDERTRLAREQADALEFKNQAARRELIPAKQVETEWASILRDLRASLLSIPSRVQQRLGTLPQADVSVLDREIRDVLTELGGDARD